MGCCECNKFNYKLLLLPISLTSIILPYCIQELQTFIWFGVFHFISISTLLFVFPSILVFFQTRPIYFDEMENDSKNQQFAYYYIVLLNIITSLLWGMFANYLLMKHIFDKPIFEAMGIIGGNIALFGKVQYIGGNFLLYVCYRLKKWHVHHQ